LGLVPELNQIKVLVAGDLMLDTFCTGTVHRKSPEAPVDVLDWESKVDCAGGAANVALNILGLGAGTKLTGWIGNDHAGNLVRELLQQNQISDEGLMELPNSPTTHKTRFLNGSKHLLRVDRESRIPIREDLMEQQTGVLESLLQGCDAVVMQDYDKGYFNAYNTQNLISLCQRHQIPVAVDPKKDQFWLYRGVDLFKPNLKELEQALGRSLSLEGDELRDACRETRERLGCRILMVTLGERGMAVMDQETWYRTEGLPRHVVDVCGAGDSVIAAAACGLARGLNAKPIADLANLCGGLACEHSGTRPVTLDQIRDSINPTISPS
jgi:rfaE bifunctional protein kinase chain/domain